jgi:4-amino-4-deoxy-L-arabinose transferase-like glycosyltransferase
VKAFATRRGVLAALVLVVAFGLRVAEIQRVSYSAIFDAGSYLKLADQIAHTGDYASHPIEHQGAGGTLGPSAYFPPGFPYYLGAIDVIGGNKTLKGPAVQPARYGQAVLGTITVAMIGLVAFECFGWTVALTAMILAAIFPVFIAESGILVAENLFTPLVLAAVWAALRTRRSTTAGRRYGWVIATGVLTGLSALTHFEGIVLVIPLAFALGWTKPRKSLAAPALLVLITVLTILPWTIRNAVELHTFIPVSDEAGITLVGTYNPASAAYEPVPWKWRIFAAIPGEHKITGNPKYLTEPQLGSKLETQAFDYIGNHPTAPLQVAFHNTLRMFELEGTFAWHASTAALDIDIVTARVGVISFWILCLIAIAGLFTRVVRQAPLWLWAVPILLAISVVLVNVETPRFREPIDPYLILLAACAIGTLVGRLRRAPVGRDDGPAVASAGGEPVEVIERLA